MASWLSSISSLIKDRPVEAYRTLNTLLAQLEQAKALEQHEAAEANITKSDVTLAELGAMIDKFGDTLIAASASTQKTQSRGIALTHMEGQGGAANGRNTPLLMKSVNNHRCVEINKACRSLKATELDGGE